MAPTLRGPLGASPALKCRVSITIIKTTSKGLMHHIEYIGSYTAVSTTGGEEVRITTKRIDPVPPLCRALIARGADPQAAARVTHSGMAVWRKDRSLAAWAGIDITDEDRDGLRTRAYRPR